jgi:hypothetical protein
MSFKDYDDAKELPDGDDEVIDVVANWLTNLLMSDPDVLAIAKMYAIRESGFEPQGVDEDEEHPLYDDYYRHLNDWFEGVANGVAMNFARSQDPLND